MTTKTLKPKKEDPSPSVPFLYRPFYTLPLLVRLLMPLLGCAALAGFSVFAGSFYAQKHAEIMTHTEMQRAAFSRVTQNIHARVDRLEEGRTALDNQISPCAQLEKTLKDVQDIRLRVSAFAEDLNMLQNGTVDSILEELGVLDKEVSNTSLILADLSKRLSTLEEKTVKPETILMLIGRIEEVQTELHQRFKERQHFALLSSVTLLKDSVYSGRPFEVEMLTTRSLGSDDSYITLKIKDMLPYAAHGIPSEPKLLFLFDEAFIPKPQAVTEVSVAPATFLSKVKKALSSLVVVRRADTGSTKMQIELVREQFKKFLEAGDYPSAALSLNLLPETHQALLNDSGFIKSFQSYVAVRSALRDLMTYTYAAIAADRLNP